MDTTPTAAQQPQQTWTFFGHWDNDRIVVEYVLEGEVADDRQDTGTWDQGLWAASASGDTMEQAQATAIAEYEDDDWDDVFDAQCRHCARPLRSDTRQDTDGSTRCDDADPYNAHHVPVGAYEPTPVYSTTDGRQALIMFEGGDDTGLSPLRNADGALRIAYLLPDGTEANPALAEYAWYDGALTRIRDL